MAKPMGWARGLTQQPLSTRDKLGNRYVFYYTIDDHGFDVLSDFVVHVSDTAAWPRWDGRLYQMTLKVYDDHTLQTTNMENNNLSEYRGKGISEALIPEISRVLKKDILSSPPFVDGAERRSPWATVIWKRLVSAGVAVPEGDRFRVTYAIAKTLTPHSATPPAPSPRHRYRRYLYAT